jgi:hypothetical protein
MIKCDLCGKNYMGAAMLQKHMDKVHAAPSEEEAQAQEAVEPMSNEMVVIRGADPRVKLEVSIGDMHWVGQSITVPAQYAGQVRALLEAGGYLLKD